MDLSRRQIHPLLLVQSLLFLFLRSWKTHFLTAASNLRIKFVLFLLNLFKQSVKLVFCLNIIFNKSYA